MGCITSYVGVTCEGFDKQVTIHTGTEAKNQVKNREVGSLFPGKGSRIDGWMK